jgi:molecular chaperone HscB
MAMDPFATLGLPWRFDVDVPLLESRYRDLQRALHPDRHAGAGASVRRMSLSKAVEVNDAYRVLKDELKRAEALLSHHAHGVPLPTLPVDPELLMEVMALREALGDAKCMRDSARVRELATRVETSRGSARRELAEAFASLAETAEPAALSRVAALIGRLKYYTRFLDEVALIEYEALG